MSQAPGTVAIVGGGVIGGGWAARFLLHGWNVQVFDPQPAARERLAQVLDNARASLPVLADAQMPAEGSLSFADSLAEAVTDASWIQESVPEDLVLKRKVLTEIETHAPSATPIASSTSGFKPSELQQGAKQPERIIVAHPFNPVYLLPLVEVVAGDVAVADQAGDVLTSVGMRPLTVRKEIDAHIADRLLEAVWRESLWLVNDDVATTEEIDDAIRFGFGLRWAQMGLFETFRLAGGDGGMRHFISQFGPSLKWPWTKLMDVPELTEELIEKVASQSDAQSGAHSITELERIRDRNLVGMLRALKERDWGAGAVLNKHDRRLANTSVGMTDLKKPITGQPARMLELTVLPAWIDYNGHMTEHRYAQVFADTCDQFLVIIGMSPEYVASTGSYYTVETHIMYLDEVLVNAPMYSTTQVLKVSEKTLHLFHRLHAGEDDRVLSVAEQFYLHVGTDGKVCAADAELLARANAFAAAHADIPLPEQAGRYVGQRKER